jgi:hypothetical protein
MNDLSFWLIWELNYVLFIAFGIWFTLICFIKMFETAVQTVFPKE